MDLTSRLFVPFFRGVLIGLSIVGLMYVLLSILLLGSQNSSSVYADAKVVNNCVASGASAEFCGCIDEKIDSSLSEPEAERLASSDTTSSYAYQASVANATEMCSNDTRLTVN